MVTVDGAGLELWWTRRAVGRRPGRAGGGSDGLSSLCTGTPAGRSRTFRQRL